MLLIVVFHFRWKQFAFRHIWGADWTVVACSYRCDCVATHIYKRLVLGRLGSHRCWLLRFHSVDLVQFLVLREFWRFVLYRAVFQLAHALNLRKNLHASFELWRSLDHKWLFDHVRFKPSSRRHVSSWRSCSYLSLSTCKSGVQLLHLVYVVQHHLKLCEFDVDVLLTDLTGRHYNLLNLLKQAL